MAPIYPLARGLLFRRDPEDAHGAALRWIARLAGHAAGRQVLRTVFGPPVVAPVEVCGLRFGNRVGLAAGYDKDGTAWRGLAALGFGHIEIGTVTPRPQPGNDRPRVFRLVQDQAIINRMGFPGQGMAAVLPRLGGPRPVGLVLGVNLGKNRDTPLERAAQDYLQVLEQAAPVADYFAVNVSSPNTPGLRSLQTPETLRELLETLVAARKRKAAELSRPLPMLVKLSPDLGDRALDSAVDTLLEAGVDGVIATNTTLERAGLRAHQAAEAGGLSGAPLTRRALTVIERVAARAQGRLPIVAVGGIMTADDARARIEAGATLVQLYTGLIFKGPALVREVAHAIAADPTGGSSGG